MRKLLNAFLHIPFNDPDIQRRSRHLNILLLGSIAIPLIAILSVFVLNFGSSAKLSPILSGVIILTGSLIIYLIHRQGYYALASFYNYDRPNIKEHGQSLLKQGGALGYLSPFQLNLLLSLSKKC